MVTLNPVSPRVQNQKQEGWWGFSHTGGFTGWGLEVHLMSLGNGNLAEVQAAFMERWLIGGYRTMVRTQVEGNMQRQAGSLDMFQGVELMLCRTSGTAC